MSDRNNHKSSFVRITKKIASRAVMRTMMISLALVVGLASSATAFPKGKLLVKSYNGSDWDIYVMNEDGSGLQPIDMSSSGIGNADFSPDGSTILYLSAIGDVRNVYQVPTSGGTKTLVYSTSGLPQISTPIWGDSPDHFYYTLTLGGTCGNRIREIHRRAIDGSYDDTIIKVSSGNLSLTDIKESLNRSVYNDNIPPGCWSPLGAIVTYDLSSGEEKWKWMGDSPDYGSPALVTVSGTTLIITPMKSHMVALNLTDGQPVWEIPFAPIQRGLNGVTPVVDGQTVYYAGTSRGITAVRIEKEGDTFVFNEVWHHSDKALKYLIKKAQSPGWDLFLPDFAQKISSRFIPARRLKIFPYFTVD